MNLILSQRQNLVKLSDFYKTNYEGKKIRKTGSNLNSKKT